MGALRAAAEAVGGADFWGDGGRVVDLDQYAAFQAWSIATGNEDIYPYRVQNYYLYLDPSDGRFDFIPGAGDEAFDDGFDWDEPRGLVGVSCMADPDCTSTLNASTADILSVYEGSDPQDYAEAIFAASDASLDSDARRGTTASSVRAARARVAHGGEPCRLN